RRNAERQREGEDRTAGRGVARRDAPAMRLDDRATDRKTETHAGRGRLAHAAGEFLEYRLLLALRYTRPRVGDTDEQVVAGDLCRNRDRRTGGRVLGRVLDQVVEHALDQRRVEFDQRQIRRQANIDP